MTVTASVQPESGRIAYVRSNFPDLFQFRFSTEGMAHIEKNRPRSDLDGLVRVWPNASGLEASWCAGIISPGFWQDATGPLPVPTFRLGSVLPQTSRIILCKTSPDPIQFWLTVSGFSQTDPVRKQASVQESSGPLLANVSQPIQTGCESDPACLLGTLGFLEKTGAFYKIWSLGVFFMTSILKELA